MEKKVKAEEIVSVSGITVATVVEVRLHCRSMNGCLFFSAVKQPLAVVLVSGETKKAFDLEGKEVPLDKVAGIPGLRV